MVTVFIHIYLKSKDNLLISVTESNRGNFIYSLIKVTQLLLTIAVSSICIMKTVIKSIDTIKLISLDNSAT